MTALRVTAHPPRCYVAGLRVHHGLTGVLLIAAGLASRRRGVFALGALLTIEDFGDWPWSLFDGH
jgi:hypothetical protein